MPRHIRLGWLAALVVFASAAAVAQTTQNLPSAPLVVRDLGAGTVALDGPWNFHTSDDSSWASPAFDDSNWTTVDIARPWGDQGFWAYTGFEWYRRHVDFGQAREVAIFVPVTSVIYQLYWNGRLIADHGFSERSFLRRFPP